MNSVYIKGKEHRTELEDRTQPVAPHLGGVSQALFPGTSVNQLDGLVDLLMNYDDYTARQTTIKSMVKEAPPAEGGDQAAEASEPRPDQSASDLTGTGLP